MEETFRLYLLIVISFLKFACLLSQDVRAVQNTILAGLEVIHSCGVVPERIYGIGM